MNISTDWHWCWSSKSLKSGQHADSSNSSPQLSLTHLILTSLSLSNYRTPIDTQKNHTVEAPRRHKYKTAAGLTCPSVSGCGRWSYDTAAITEFLTVTIELTAAAHGVLRWWKKLLSVSNWATWSNTSSLWGCSARGRSLAESGNTGRPSLASDRRILFIHGQLIK